MQDMIDRTPRRIVARAMLTASGIALSLGLMPAAARAEDPPGAVVQAVPPPQAAQLSEAMRKLSSDPKDLDALIAAGDASLVLHDPEAAGNFYARAAVIAPNDGRVRLGYARVALADRRPVEALLLFDQAEKAGADMAPAALERALAFDLVGDNASAQAIYRAQLRKDEDTQTRLRLAISQAIAGQRAEFDKTLYPLLQKQDRGAFRTRAFGLAILGHPDEAVKIADAMMPADLALRMAPYLRYMPRLTRAQQAAAADLGIFPASAEIGRDSTAIAQYESTHSHVAAGSDAALIPQGAAMGPRADEKPARLASKPKKPARLARSGAELPAIGPVQGPPAQSVEQSQPVPRAVSSPQRSTPAPPPAPPPPPPPPPPQPAPRESVADAFAGLGPAPRATASAHPGAVNMARFKPRLEQVEKPKPAKKEKTPEELYPARYWVQVATGRNRKALGWDWRRIAKKANGILDNEGPFVTKWVEANRLLAGPYPSEEAADKIISKLKHKGIDCFAYTSAAGEKIDQLD